MGGKPNWFQVTNLEVLARGGASGSEMMDVIVVHTVGAGDEFDLLVTFEASDRLTYWFAAAEATSDGGAAIDAEAEFYAESVGPGPEMIVGTATVTLTANGDPGGSPVLNTSLYQARLQIADANTIFVDAADDLAPGLYRIGCAVHVQNAVPQYADAYFQQDLLVRVVEEP
jgi:hypothetical protein